MILKGIGASELFEANKKAEDLNYLRPIRLVLSDVTTVNAGGSQCFPPV